MRVIVAAAVVLAGSTAVAGPMPAGRWRSLLTDGKTWTLPITGDKHDSSPTSITLHITGVRQVGAAQVATLEWSLDGGTDESMEEVDLLPTQIAITKKGSYAFGSTENATDKVIAAAIKKRKPTFKQSTTATVRHGKGRSAWASGFAFTPPTNPDVACFGFDTTDPDLDMGGEPTTSWLCFDRTDVVGAFDGSPRSVATCSPRRPTT